MWLKRQRVTSPGHARKSFPFPTPPPTACALAGYACACSGWLVATNGHYGRVGGGHYPLTYQKINKLRANNKLYLHDYKKVLRY